MLFLCWELSDSDPFDDEVSSGVHTGLMPHGVLRSMGSDPVSGRTGRRRASHLL